MKPLAQEIDALEARLPPSSTRDELAHIRRDLADTAEREPGIELANLRLGFACKERWEDMIGDDRVRACGGCDRPVFNLSAMTRAAAERLLATRGLTPCVRFYRRSDGTVMTADCPTGERRVRRRLAVVTSSLAAGAALAAPTASADPDPDLEASAEADPSLEAPIVLTPIDDGRTRIEYERWTAGIPVSHTIRYPEPRPAIEWSIWGRLGLGISRQPPKLVARRLTPPEAESSTMWEAALAADVTVGVARHGNIRLGAWAEVRTSTGPVAGGELVVQGLPPYPSTSRIGGSGTLVLRAGGNAHVITAALGFGYVGAWPRTNPWFRRVDHLVGARLVASVNRSLDDPEAWSATFGLEVEPIGAVRAVFELITDD